MENLCGEERTHVSRRATLFFIEILYLNFFEKCRKFNFIRKLHIRKRGRGSVGVSNLIPLPRREPRRATRHQG